MSSPRRAIRALLLAGLITGTSGGAAAVADGPAPQAALEPVPRPVLDTAEPRVAAQLTTARTNLDALAADGSIAGTDLAGAFGRLGQLYLYYNFDDAAAAAFENARRLHPADARWAYYLGVIAHERGDVAGAREALGEVLERRPIDVPSHLRLGMIELDQGNFDAAEKHFEQALALDPRSASALNGLGQIAATRGDNEKAVRYFLRTLALQPDATSVNYSIGLAYRQLGDLDTAREFLAMRGDRRVAFADPLVVGLGMLSADAGPHIERGGAALRRGDLKTAEEAYRRALAVDPGSTPARQGLATTLAQKGDLDGASAVYEEVLAHDPGGGSAAIQRDYGQLLVHGGRVEAGIEHLRRAVELAPDDGDLRLGLAQALEAAGQTREAATVAARATELSSGNATALLLHGHLLVANQLAGSDDPLAALDAVVAAHPETPEVLYAAAAELEARGQNERAGALFERVTGLEGASEIRARAHLQLADLRTSTSAAGDALAHLRAAVELAPDLAEGHVALAKQLGSAGQLEAAADEFEAAIEHGADTATVHLARVTALLRAGEEATAWANLERDVRSFPRHAGLHHALARLLATAEAPELRDGERALQMSREIFRESPSVEHAETVAMALAELGRYDEAVAWQEKVIAKAESLGRQDRLEALRRNLALYQKHQPVRAPWRP